MKRELLELICCPHCGGHLQFAAASEDAVEVWQGCLSCLVCAAEYPIENGIPHLYCEDERWQSKAREAAGWVTIHKQLDIYDVAADSVDLKIPYYPEEPWVGVARSFDMSLDHLQLTGDETILDLGAGRGWAAKHFARLGCRVVALDVVDDENIGLGRARALMDDAGVYFDRVIGDGENLPFFADRFDLVFCAAALHHFSDLPLLFENIGRVLRPGGQLCAMNEPCIAVYASEEKILEESAAPELEVGINERRPSLFAYREALAHAGLEPVKLLPAPVATMSAAAKHAWAQDVGALPPDFSWRNRKLPQQIARYVGKRFLALRSGSLHRARRYLAEQDGDSATAIMLWSGNEIFLLAEKR